MVFDYEKLLVIGVLFDLNLMKFWIGWFEWDFWGFRWEMRKLTSVWTLKGHAAWVGL